MFWKYPGKPKSVKTAFSGLCRHSVELSEGEGRGLPRPFRPCSRPLPTAHSPVTCLAGGPSHFLSTCRLGAYQTQRLGDQREQLQASLGSSHSRFSESLLPSLPRMTPFPFWAQGGQSICEDLFLSHFSKILIVKGSEATFMFPSTTATHKRCKIHTVFRSL